jgi:L-fuculose-phosphate aldolase
MVEYKETGFQTFFASREISKCSLVGDIISTSKRLYEIGLFERNIGEISVRYGNRIVMTTNNSNMKNLSLEDLVEIVDYDPIKQVALVIGLNEPSREVQMHWLIYRARKDVNAIIHVNDLAALDKVDIVKSGNIPVIEKGERYNAIKSTLEVIKALKDSKYVLIRDYGSVAIGMNLKDAEEIVMKIHEECKKL